MWKVTAACGYDVSNHNHRWLWVPAFARTTWSMRRELAAERPRDRGLRVALDLPQVFLAAKTLRVDLVDVLGARRARGEPAVVGRDLDAAERLSVAGRGGNGRANRLAGQFFHSQLFARQRLQQILLRRCRRRVDALVERHAEFSGQVVEQLAWIAAGARGHIGG